MKTEHESTHQKQLQVIGMYFREIRLSNGMTQKELSQLTNISFRTIQRLEAGENVSLLSLFKIAEALDVDVMRELLDES